MRIIPDDAKYYRQGDPLSANDLRPRSDTERARDDVRGLMRYYQQRGIPRSDEPIVALLAVHGGRVLMAAFYDHPGARERPTTALSWLDCTRRLLAYLEKRAAREAEDDANMSRRGGSYKESTWRLGRSPGSYGP